MSSSFLGPHVNQTHGGLPEFVATWKPPVALILDHSSAWHWVKQESPKTIMIGRWFWEQQPDFENIDPVALARQEMAELLPSIKKSPYDYIAGRVNEPVVNSAKAMSNLAKYDIARMEILARHGRRAAIGQFATGSPGDLNLWEHYFPALEAAVKYRGILILHQYDWEHIGENGVWLPFRHELIYNGGTQGWGGVPKSLRVPIVITEYGLDEGAVHNGVRVGWRGADDPLSGGRLTKEGYMMQMNGGMMRIMQTKEVLGACIFCIGNISSDWVMFDFWPEIKDVCPTPLYREPVWPKQDKTPPEEETDDGLILGIDVSYAQRGFPWEKALLPTSKLPFRDKKGRIRFAIMRVSRDVFEDRDCRYHFSNTYDKIPTGGYHFITARYSGKDQAKTFWNFVKLVKFPMGYFLDVEWPDVYPSLVQEFCDEFEYLSGIRLDYYTSFYKWKKLVGYKNSGFTYGSKLWVAHWNQNVAFPLYPPPWSKDGVALWQYGVARAGTLDWYKRDLDMDVWLGTKEEFEAIG